MSPRDQWPELWHFFDVLHQDWDTEFEDKHECLSAWTGQADVAELRSALTQWHDAFDTASDEQVTEIVRTFNAWWDADQLFGGARQWADWVREHLEAELARRTSS
jgi:hypothetical protein